MNWTRFTALHLVFDIPSYASHLPQLLWLMMPSHQIASVWKQLDPTWHEELATSHLPCREEVIALVIHHNESREILNLNLPDGLHAKLGVLQHLHLLDAVAREDGGGAANGAQVEAAVLLARVGHHLGPVALSQRDKRAAVGHEAVHVAVHAPCRGGPKAAGRVALGRLGGARVVDDVVLDGLGQTLAALQPLLQLGVRNVARHHQRARQAQARADGVLGQLLADGRHGLRQVHLDHLRAQLLGGHVGQEAARVALQSLDEQPILAHHAHRLAVSRARDTDAHWAGRAVAGQAHDAHVVAEVLAAKLCADAHLARDVQDLGLPVQVAERPPARVAAGGQPVKVPGRRQLDHLEVVLGAHAADYHRQVVGRARRGAQRLDLLLQELGQRRGVEQRLGLLEQHRLVGAAAALGHEQELVLAAGRGVQLDLGGQVAARVLLVEHVQRCHLRVAQVGLRVRLEHAAAQRLLVLAVRPHVLPALAHDDGRARVLATGQHHACSNVGVLEQLKSHKLVIG
mmetsp:Transcript_25535/g.64791  ORF Transcript_25535/g.64791 Transcript_25535/m.64791 type:complete len:514 (-) Transcript_25535:434-1975(-)